MTNTELCIGGPCDGLRYAIPRGDSFQVTEMPDVPGPLSQADTTTYVRHTFTFEGITYGVWVPEGQSLTTTIKKLLAGYRP